MSWAVWWAFFQIWLTSPRSGLELNGTEVGSVFAVNGVALAVMMLIYGRAQDRLGLRRHLLVLIGALASLTGPFVTFVYKPLLLSHFYLGAVLGAILFAAAFQGATAIFEAYFDRLSRAVGFEFGHTRTGGSFGYGVATLTAGFLFSYNPELIFWASSVFGVLLLVVQLLWPIDAAMNAVDAEKLRAVGAGESQERRGMWEDLFAAVRNPKLWALSLYVVFGWGIYGIFESQMFPEFFTGKFVDPVIGQRYYGVLIAVQTTIEALLMLVVPMLITRIGPKRAMLLGVCMMIVPVLGAAVGQVPLVVGGAKLFHALMVACTVLSVVRYVALHFDASVSATVYLLGFYVTNFLSTTVFSRPFGALRDAVGFETTFLVIGAVLVVCLVASFFLLEDDDDVVPFRVTWRR